MIVFDRVVHRYPDSQFALGPISLSLSRGERLLVVGLNGSGKSTLLRLAASLIKPSEGQLNRDGSIGYVFQNPESQILTNSVETELAFNLENRAVDPAEMRTLVLAAAREFRFEKMLRHNPTKLSAGEKQRLALASTLISDPQIVLVDEAQSYLDSTGRDLFDKHLFGSREHTIISATHDLTELDQFDQVMVLEHGKVAFHGEALEFKATDLYRHISSGRQGKDRLRHRADSANRSIAVRAEGWMYAYPDQNPLIDGLDLELQAGSITGIIGDSGSGKTTLALLLSGLIKPDSGAITIGDQLCTDAELVKQVGYVFQIPEISIFAETVSEEVSFGLQNAGVANADLKAAVESALSTVGLEPRDYAERNPFTLSAGEQRLVAIASIIALNRPVLIFDESMAGLDWINERRIFDMIENQRAQGRAIIVISHSRQLLDTVADRILELRSGKLLLIDHSKL